MTRLPRPCLGWKTEACGEPTTQKRCPRHLVMLEAARPSPSRRGYDRQYRKDRAVVLAPVNGRPRVCALQLPGCTYWADTADHVIAGDDGRNPLSRRGPLRPACAHCNSARGKRDVEVGAVDEPEAWTPDP